MYNASKLTKRLWFPSDTGVYIASGFMERDVRWNLKRILHGYVPDVAARKSFWTKIKEAKADQRNCYIFKHQDEHKLFMDKFRSSKFKSR